MISYAFNPEIPYFHVKCTSEKFRVDADVGEKKVLLTGEDACRVIASTLGTVGLVSAAAIIALCVSLLSEMYINRLVYIICGLSFLPGTVMERPRR